MERVLQQVGLLYDAHSTGKVRRNADLEIQRFVKTKDAAQYCVSVLESEDLDDAVAFLLAKIVHEKVIKQGSKGIFDKLWKLMHFYVCRGKDKVANKLALAIVVIILKERMVVSQVCYAQFVFQLCSSYCDVQEHNFGIMVLLLVKHFPVECERFKEYHAYFVESTESIMQHLLRNMDSYFKSMHAQKRKDNGLLLQCFNEWLPECRSVIVVDDKLLELCIGNIVQGQLVNNAVDCVCFMMDVLVKVRDKVALDRMFQWIKILMHRKTGDLESVIRIVGKFVHDIYSIAFRDSINVQTELFLILHRVTMLHVTEDDYIFQCWCAYYKHTDVQLANNSIRMLMKTVLSFSTIDANLPGPGAEMIRHRTNVRNFLRDLPELRECLVSILLNNIQDIVATLSTEFCEKNEQWWRDLESNFHALSALVSKLNTEQLQFLTTLLPIIIQLPLHPALQCAVTMVISGCNHWTSCNLEYMEYVLRIIENSFQFSEYGTPHGRYEMRAKQDHTGAVALVKLVETCGSALCNMEFIQDLYTFYTCSIFEGIVSAQSKSLILQAILIGMKHVQMEYNVEWASRLVDYSFEHCKRVGSLSIPQATVDDICKICESFSLRSNFQSELESIHDMDWMCTYHRQILELASNHAQVEGIFDKIAAIYVSYFNSIGSHAINDALHSIPLMIELFEIHHSGVALEALSIVLTTSLAKKLENRVALIQNTIHTVLTKARCKNNDQLSEISNSLCAMFEKILNSDDATLVDTNVYSMLFQIFNPSEAQVTSIELETCCQFGTYICRWYRTNLINARVPPPLVLSHIARTFQITLYNLQAMSKFPTTVDAIIDFQYDASVTCPSKAVFEWLQICILGRDNFPRQGIDASIKFRFIESLQQACRDVNKRKYRRTMKSFIGV